MDTATLAGVNAVLVHAGIRGAARALQRPPASIAAAVARMETELAVPLVQKTGSSLMLTLEGTRIAPRLADLVFLVKTLFAPDEAAASAAGDTAMPPMISLDALSRLLVVARTGSIRAAARMLNLGQPQLTRQIAHVETVLGFAVLERRRDGAVPTAQGLRAIETIRRIEDLWRDLSTASDERFRRAENTVRVGSVMPLGPDSQIADLLASLAARWRRTHPRQPLFITSMIAEELLNSVRRGLFDAVLLDLAALPADLDGRLLSASPLAVVAHRHLIGTAPAVDAAAILRAHPIAIPSLRSGLRQTIDQALVDLIGEAGRRAAEVVEIDSIPVIMKMVARHGFVSILPSVSLAALHGDLVSLPLSDRYLLPLWIAWPRIGPDPTIGRQIFEMFG